MSNPTRGLFTTALLLAFGSLAWMSTPAQAQSSWKVDMVGHFPLTRGSGNDVWGYSADGVEVAIMGTTLGTSFIDVTDPANPVELAFISGPVSTWRDIKTYDQYAYIVNEAGGGLQIVSLVDPLDPVEIEPRTASFETAHNIYIDEAAGMLYAVGAPGNATYALDLSRPTAPSLRGTFRGFYLHDIYVRDGIAYGAAINRGDLATLDVSDPSAMVALDTIETPGNFAHNTWLSDDGKYCFTTDEISGGRVGIFDVEDPENLAYVGDFRNPIDSNAIIHNVTVRDGLAFVSWYTTGLQVVDVRDPLRPVHAGYFDTYPGTGGGFQGAWGVYPYAASGFVYVSDINSGLYILDFTGHNATAAVSILDVQSGEPVLGAQVDTGRGVVEADESGRLELSLRRGLNELSVSAFGYESKVELVEAEALDELELQIRLTPEPWGQVRGVLADFETGDPLMGVMVSVLDTPLSATTAEDGSFGFDRVPAGEYLLQARVFGFQPLSFAMDVRAEETRSIELPALPTVFFDDAEDDRGWSLVAPGDDATSGLWERVDPSEVVAGLAQPGTDVSAWGSHAFVTGAAIAGDTEADHDVDGGRTTLTTPLLDLSALVNPTIEYSRWFSNNLGGNPGQDVFRADVSSDGGLTWTSLETLSASTNAWVPVSFDLSAYVEPSAAILVRFIAEDTGGGSLVEAAIDDVSIFERRAVLSGHVVEAQSGKPIAGARVEFVEANEALAFEVATDSSGEFRSVLLPGVHTIRVEAFGYELFEESVELQSGRDLAIELSRQPRGMISGTLERSGSQRPVSGVAVMLEGTPLRTLSRADGSFVFEDVPEGSYEMRTDDVVYEAGPVSVLVESGETTTLKLSARALLATGLDAAYPNPFIAETVLRFQLADPQDVSIHVYDGGGRLIRTVTDATFEAGEHEVPWDGRDDRGHPAPAGLYFQVLRTEGATDTGKVLRLR